MSRVKLLMLINLGRPTEVQAAAAARRRWLRDPARREDGARRQSGK